MQALPAAAFQRHKWGAIDALIWGLILIAYFVADRYLQLGTQVLIMIILALSLDLAIGFSGIESLGHAVFFGLGGYAAALFALNVSSDPFLGLLAGALVAGVFGFLSGLFVLRTRGLTQVILTMAVATVMLHVATTAKGLTGGDDGLSGYKIDPLLGLYSFDLYGRVSYVYASVILFVVFLICRAVVNSPFGLTVRGIRDNTTRMRLLGVPVTRRLVVMYSISGALAGVAGALSAQVTGVVATDSMSFLISGNVLIVLLLGGMGRLTGVFLGSAIFVVVSDRAAAIDPFNWFFVLGVLLILVVRFTPQGLSVWLERLLGDRLRLSRQ